MVFCFVLFFPGLHLQEMMESYFFGMLRLGVFYRDGLYAVERVDIVEKR